MRKHILLFVVIVFIAVFLRFWQLDVIPPGIHADEAAGTYATYSILKTGLEPHGRLNLLALEDLNTGGTHPSLNTYFQMPFVKILGLNAYSVRLPSAIMGAITVVFFFFILMRLFGSQKIAFLGMFLLAINPWALHISRQGLGEAISIFTILLGTTMYLYSQKKLYMFILSAIFFGLSVFSYDAPKIFLPPFILLLIFFTRDWVFKAKSYLLVFLLIILSFYLVMLKLTFFDNGLYHFSRANIFESVAENVDSERFQTNAPLWLSSIFHNKLSVSLKRFETSYVSIFSLNWFFVNGSGNLQHSVGNHGEFFLFEMPFFFIGIYLAFKKSYRLGTFLLGWMLIGAIPGGLTTGNYAYRSVHVLPIPIIFSSLGIIWFWEKSNKFLYIIKSIARLILLTLMLIYISSYLYTYFFDYSVYASEYWNKQQNDAIKFVSEESNKYKNVFVDGGEPWAIEYAFINKLDPLVYQNAFKNNEKFKNINVIKIKNIYFGIFNLGNIEKPSEFFPKNSLVVTNAVNFSKEKFIKSFNDPGRIRAIFKIFEVR